MSQTLMSHIVVYLLIDLGVDSDIGVLYVDGEVSQVKILLAGPQFVKERDCVLCCIYELLTAIWRQRRC